MPFVKRTAQMLAIAAISLGCGGTTAEDSEPDSVGRAEVTVIQTTTTADPSTAPTAVDSDADRLTESASEQSESLRQGPFIAVSVRKEGYVSHNGCAIRVAGTIVCWGDAIGTRLVDGKLPNTPSGSFSAISLGSSHACGLRTDQTIECWDITDDSQYEDLDDEFRIDFGGALEAPSGNFGSVASSATHSCGLRTDGRVECWGNIGGAHWEIVAEELGISLGSDTPFAAPSGSFSHVAVSNMTSCGVRTNGEIECWGLADLLGGQYQPLSGSFSAVAVGTYHVCGLSTDGKIDCDGLAAGGVVPSELQSVTEAPSGSFTALAAGNLFSCGVRTDDSIECWGDSNYFGQLDAPPGSFTSVSISIQDACALRTDGTIACWGWSGDSVRIPTS